MSNLITDTDRTNLSELVGLVRELNHRGHSPATSGNYSIRSSEDLNCAYVSESGFDKSTFTEMNFIPVDIHSVKKIIESDTRKTSDETEVHLAIYRKTNANCVLHSHMQSALLFCDLHKGKAFADIKNLELLKGFSGIKTHDISIQIPIFENTQDITTLSKVIEPSLTLDQNCYAILLQGHGIYVFGKSVKETKKHLEVFEYIFSYYLQKKLLGV